MKNRALVIAAVLISMNASSQSIVKEYQIQKKYLNLPVDMQQDRQLVHFLSAKDTITYSVIRVADGEPDYWVFKDVSAWKGKNLKLVFSKHVHGIELIYQSDRFARPACSGTITRPAGRSWPFQTRQAGTPGPT